jgi:hypothetical protein
MTSFARDRPNPESLRAIFRAHNGPADPEVARLGTIQPQ